MTDAKNAFDRNLKRARAFTRIFDAGSLKPAADKSRGPGNPSAAERELLRAAVIFSIGALDAYLSDVAAEVMVAQLDAAKAAPTDEGRSLLRRVLKEVDTLAIELALAGAKADRQAIARRALEDHLSNRVSNHGAQAIAATLARMGSQIDWAKVDVDSKAVKPLKTSSTKTAPAILDYWTKRRHEMIHQGKAPTIWSEQARGVIAFVEAIGTYVDAEAEAAKAP